jgi:YVTN family beta-propeller protein
MRFTFLTLCLSFCTLAGFSQTITTGAISGTSFCAGDNLSVPFTVSPAISASTTYTAQLSTSTGSFSTTVSLGSFTGSAVSSGTVSATIPVSTGAGSAYRIRVRITGTNGSNNGTDLVIRTAPDVAQPASQVICKGGNTSAINFTGGASNSYYSWTNSLTSIGLAASGKGNIAAFTTTNGGATALVSTLTVNAVTGGMAYIANSGDNNVSVINTATSAVVATINVGTSPRGLAISLDGGHVYVANNGSNNVTVINTATNTVAATVTVGSGPRSLAVTPDGSSVYVTNDAAGTVSVIDASTNTVTATITVGTNPRGIAITPDGTEVYTANNGSNNVTVISTSNNTVSATIAVGTTPQGLTINSTGSRAYVANGGSDNVSVINTSTHAITTTIAAGDQPYGVATGGGYLYISNFGDNTLTVIATADNSLEATIAVGTGPRGVTLSDDQDRVYVSNNGSDNVTVITTSNHAVEATIAVGNAPVTLGAFVAPTACVSADKTSTITVNPTPTSTTTNKTFCPGATGSITMTGAVSGSSYAWANSNTSIGLAASGTGNIASFTATNSGNVAISATISVTPSYTNGGVTCTGAVHTFTITVNPTPTVNSISNQSLCDGGASTAINFTGNVAGTDYTWTNSDNSINLASSGTGNISSFTSSNNTSAPVTATITVSTEYTSGGISCIGGTRSFSITVNPVPVMDDVEDLVACSGSTVATAVFGSNVAGTSYAWTNNLVSIGLASSGSGSIGSFTATNATNAALAATVAVTPSYSNAGRTCAGANVSYTITVNPLPNVSGISDQNLCNGASTSAISFSGSLSGTVFSWTNSITTIGLAASGSGTIAPFAAGNNTAATQSALLSVTPSFTNAGLACAGAAQSWHFNINPTPGVNTIASQAVCSGSAVTAINFSGAVTGTVYNWTSSSNAVALAGSGTGNISSFTQSVSGTPAATTITVTPHTTNGALTCNGSAASFSITINPIPSVNVVANKVYCNGSSSSAISFSGNTTGSAFNWTNVNTATGLAASGTGTIAAFTATNGGSVQTSGIVQVTPQYTNAGTTCTGSSTSFIVSVNPTPTVSAIPNKIYCNSGITSTITPTGSPVSGTVYGWTQSTPGIGLAATGTGTLPSFTAINTGLATVTDIVSITPTATFSGVACSGSAANFNIVVNPTPSVVAPASISYCSNTVVPTNSLSGPVAGSVYTWSHTNTTIGLASSGTGNIPAFVAADTSANSISDVITLGSSFTFGGLSCAGATSSYTITVKPAPTVNALANQTICAGTVSSAVSFTGTGSSYTWVNSNTTIGLAASGTGNIAAFATTNNTALVKTAVITATPLLNGCSGDPTSFVYTVNPAQSGTFSYSGSPYCSSAGTATISGTLAQGCTFTSTAGLNIGNSTGTIDLLSSTPGIYTVTAFGVAGCTQYSTTASITILQAPSDTALPLSQVICAGAATTAITFSGNAGALSYGWTNNTTSIGLAASGTGNISSFIAVNNGSTDVVATISQSPRENGCSGLPVTIRVKPRPTAVAISNQVLCPADSAAAVSFTGAVAGSIYTWTNNQAGTGLALSGTGNIAKFPATNAGTSVLTSTVTVTPSETSNGVSCSGTPMSFTIVVNPTPTLNALTAQLLCHGSSSAAINFSGGVAGTVYSWTNNHSSIGIPATGTGNISSFTAQNTGSAGVFDTLTVVPTYTNAARSCTGIARTATILVNPKPAITAISDRVLCTGVSSAKVLFSSTIPTASYSWTNTNAAIGLAASGVDSIVAFTTINTGGTAVISTITVTPSFTQGGLSCSGTSTGFTITVNPSPSISTITNKTVCVGGTQALITLGGSGVSGTVYNWTNSNTAIGLGASGSGNIASFTATNTGTTSLVGNITATPVYSNAGLACSGAPALFSITVNPQSSGTFSFTGSPFCASAGTANPSGSLTGGHSFSSTTGLSISTTGAVNLAASTAGTYTVTAAAPTGCTSRSTTATIAVKAAPNATQPSNQVVCNGSTVPALTFTGGNSSNSYYTWSRTNTGIGGTASGFGTKPSFTAVNTGTTARVDTVTVQTVTGLMVYQANSFSNVVNMINPVSYELGETITTGYNPHGMAVSPDGTRLYVANTSTGSVTVYNTATNALLATITGIGSNPTSIALTHDGSIAYVSNVTLGAIYRINTTDFSKTQIYQTTYNTYQMVISNDDSRLYLAVPSQDALVVYDIATDIAVFYNGGSLPYNVALNPAGTRAYLTNANTLTVINTANNATIATRTIGDNAYGVVVSPDGTRVYTANDNSNDVTVFNASTNTVIGSIAVGSAPSSIAISPDGLQLYVSNLASNTTYVISTVTNSVIATISNLDGALYYGIIAPSGCSATRTYTVTVNPTPSGTFSYGGSPYCQLGDTADITSTLTGGGKFSSTAGLSIDSTTGAVNLLASTAGIYTVTFTGPGPCTVFTRTASITINAIPAVASVGNQVFCAGIGDSTIAFTGNLSGTTYSWAGTSAAIGLASGGTGSIAPFTTLNTTSAAIIDTITITPSKNGCTGTATSFTITVKPTPSLSLSNKAYCAATATGSILFSANLAASTYTWTNTNTALGLAAAGTDSIASFTAVNAGNTTASGNISVTPALTGCSGTAAVFTISVLPTTSVNTVANQTLCNAHSSGAVIFSGGATGTSYAWTHQLPAIGLAASGSGTIDAFFISNTGSNILSDTFTVTPSLTTGGVTCVGATKNFVFVINPSPAITIGYHASPYCPSGTASVTRTGSSGGTYSSTSGLSINASTGDINLDLSLAGTYTVRYTSDAPCSRFTATTSVTIQGYSTWTGFVDRDWSKSGNWCGAIPTDSTNVIIPRVLNQPVIYTTGNVHHITIQSSTSLTVQGSIHLYGNMMKQGGSLDMSQGTLNLESSTRQQVPAFTATRVNVMGGGGFTLAGASTVSDTLAFSASGGFVTLDSFNLTVGAVSGGTANGFVVTNGSGAFTRKSVSTSTTMPVGISSSSYTPLTITSTEGLDWSVRVQGDFVGYPSVNQAGALQRIWHITPAISPTTQAATILFSYPDALWTSPASIRIFHYSALSHWQATDSTGFGQPSVLNGNMRQVTLTGQREFSPFALAGEGSSLPVTLLRFSGHRDGAVNQLHWTTASESNCRGFEVQRSPDGVRYIPVGFVNSLARNGNSNGILEYPFTDAGFSGSKQYYRLRQVDLDGRSKFSAVLLLRSDAPPGLNLLQAYPNPTSARLFVQLSTPVRAAVQIQVRSITGQLIRSTMIAAEAGFNTGWIDLQGLAAGTYLVQAISADGSVSQAIRVIKE